jgi:hypothetical protein
LQEQEAALNDITERHVNNFRSKQEIIINRHNRLMHVVNILLIIVFSAILTLIIRMALRRERKEKKYTLSNYEPLKEVKRPTEPIDQNVFRLIDTAVSDKRLYTPDKENALYYISKSIEDYPDDVVLNRKKDEVMGALNTKIKAHQSKKEHEPVYLIASGIY